MAPPKKKAAFPWLRWLILLPIPLIWCVASHFGWTEFLHTKFLEWRFNFRGEIDAPVKVIYVDMDSQSIAEIGNMPWDRAHFSQVCSTLIDVAGVKAVGIDVVFSENGVAESVDWKKLVEGNRELARFLIRNPPVVLAASYAAAVDRDINGNLVFRQLPLVGQHAGHDAEPPEIPSFRVNERDARRRWSPGLIGLIDTIDGGTQTVPAFAYTAVRPYLHMAVELARLHFDVPSDGVKIEADHIDLVRADGTRAARIPLRNGQLVDVNWFSKWISPRNPRIGFSTVLNYTQMLTSEKPEEQKAAADFFAQPDFKNAVVLIGPVDPLLQDLSITPFDHVDPVPRVGIHGNMLKTIVSGRYLWRLPTWHGIEWLDFMIVLGLTAAVAGLSIAGGARGVRYKIFAALLIALFVAFGFVLFQNYDYVLPMATPLGAAFATSFVAVGWQLIDEEKQKGRIKGMFSAYLAPTVVNNLIESGKEPELGGHEEEITAYFSDIQSFSTFSEILTPARLVELMNEYLTACTDIVQEEGGTLDKYIGDAVVAMFGAPISLPDHAFRAVTATIRVQKRIEELRQKWRGMGDAWPTKIHNLRARLGLNSGPAIIGNMGSRTRFSYTMMGDNVNLAARMESGAKLLGVYTMVTDSTRTACEKHGGDAVVFRFLDKIVVKGRTLPVPVHEVVGLKKEMEQRTLDCLGLHTRAMEAYLAQDWDHAIALFGESAGLEPNQPNKSIGIESNPSLIMRERCLHMKDEPPGPDWDGVYVMKDKG